MVAPPVPAGVFDGSSVSLKSPPLSFVPKVTFSDMQAMPEEIAVRGVERPLPPSVKIEKGLSDAVSNEGQNQLFQGPVVDSRATVSVRGIDLSLSGVHKGPGDSPKSSLRDVGPEGYNRSAPDISEGKSDLSVNDATSISITSNACDDPGLVGPLENATSSDRNQSLSVEREPSRGDGSFRDSKEPVSKKPGSSGTASGAAATGREHNGHTRRGDRNTEWHPLDATVERIESCLRPGSSGVKYQWYKGFRMPLGAEGRQILLRRLRKAYHASPCQWDQELARHRIVFSRMPYATVIELFHLAHLLGVFDFAVKCSEEYGGDASGSGGHRRRKGRSQQPQQQGVGQTGGETGAQIPPKFKVNGERKRSRNAAASDGALGEMQPPVSRPKRTQRAAPAYLKDYENVVESSYISNASSKVGVIKGSSLRCTDGKDAGAPVGSGKRYLGVNRGMHALPYGARIFDTNNPQQSIPEETTFAGADFDFRTAVSGNPLLGTYSTNCLIAHEEDPGNLREIDQPDFEQTCSSLERSTLLTNALLNSECFNNQQSKHLQKADRPTMVSFNGTQENFGSGTLNGLDVKGIGVSPLESTYADHLEPTKVGHVYAFEDGSKNLARWNCQALKQHESFMQDIPRDNPSSALTGGGLTGETDLNLHLLTTNYTITAQYLQAIELLAVQKQIVDLIQSLATGSDGDKQLQSLLPKSTDVGTSAQQIELLEPRTCNGVGQLKELVEAEGQPNCGEGSVPQEGLLNPSDKVVGVGSLLDPYATEKLEGLQVVGDIGSSTANREPECSSQREDLRRQSSLSYCTSDSPIRDGEDAVSVCTSLPLNSGGVSEEMCKTTDTPQERKTNLFASLKRPLAEGEASVQVL